MALPKIEAWQYEAMVDWFKNSKYAWQIHANLSPENTALKIQESYEKFQDYTSSLEPPEDGSLVKFPTWHLVRFRMYTWRQWVKKQTEKLGHWRKNTNTIGGNEQDSL